MENLVIDKEFWKNKKVFITGHTGFKGSWLLILLLELGAKIKGYSIGIEKNSLFLKLFANEKLYFEHVLGDIRDASKLKYELDMFQPEIIIHLAAQPLVRASYLDPVNTWETNLIGTINLMQASKDLNLKCTILVVTTDKVYWNQGKRKDFKENDSLGGFDPYSASKAATEIAVASWRFSFFNNLADNNVPLKLATARAGNVIGGGDWSIDRIFPDAIRSILNKEKLRLRNPNSIRPWQHVLDPLFGYLRLIEYLEKGFINEFNQFSSLAFNFGPNSDEKKTVKELIEKIFINWHGEFYIDDNKSDLYESNVLSLSIEKSEKILNWKPKFEFDIAIEKSTNWYKSFYLDSNSPLDLCLRDIKEFI